MIFCFVRYFSLLCDVHSLGTNLEERKIVVSLQTLEREILKELKIVANNPKLRNKDIMEWSTTPVEAHDGETLYHLPKLGIHCAVKISDKKS